MIHTPTAATYIQDKKEGTRRKMARHWERFTAGPTTRTADRIHITLNSKGLISFNHKTHRELGSPQAVVLYFDKATSTIGISSGHAKLREAFPVRDKKGFGWIVNAMPFCRHFGISVEGTEAFIDPEFDNQHILQLDLRTTRRVYGGKRKPRTTARPPRG